MVFNATFSNISVNYSVLLINLESSKASKWRILGKSLKKTNQEYKTYSFKPLLRGHI